MPVISSARWFVQSMFTIALRALLFISVKSMVGSGVLSAMSVVVGVTVVTGGRGWVGRYFIGTVTGLLGFAVVCVVVPVAGVTGELVVGVGIVEVAVVGVFKRVTTDMGENGNP